MICNFGIWLNANPAKPAKNKPNELHPMVASTTFQHLKNHWLPVKKPFLDDPTTEVVNSHLGKIWIPDIPINMCIKKCLEWMQSMETKSFLIRKAHIIHSLLSTATDCLKPFLSWNTPFLFSSSKSLSHYRYIIQFFRWSQNVLPFSLQIFDVPYRKFASCCLRFVWVISHFRHVLHNGPCLVHRDLGFEANPFGFVNPLDSRVRGFLKWWYPQNTPKWSFLVGKPMVVGYHHFRKHPYLGQHICCTSLPIGPSEWCLETTSGYLNKVVKCVLGCRSSIQTKGISYHCVLPKQHDCSPFHFHSLWQSSRELRVSKRSGHRNCGTLMHRASTHPEFPKYKSYSRGSYTSFMIPPDCGAGSHESNIQKSMLLYDSMMLLENTFTS